jgi:hypothetical protein
MNTSNLRFARQIAGSDVTYALGAALYELNKLPWAIDLDMGHYSVDAGHNHQAIADKGAGEATQMGAGRRLVETGYVSNTDVYTRDINGSLGVDSMVLELNILRKERQYYRDAFIAAVVALCVVILSYAWSFVNSRYSSRAVSMSNGLDIPYEEYGSVERGINGQGEEAPLLSQ